MSTSALCTALLGVFLLALHLWMLKAPDAFRAAMTAFPRSRLPGQLFTLLALASFAWNLWNVDFGGLSFLKRLLIPAVPLGWYLIVTWIPDLLSVRSLAALILLAGNPLLALTRWQGTPASLLFGVLVYILVVKALFLVAYPHLWIRSIQWSFAQASRARLLARAGCALDVMLLLTAWVSR